jgi:hypothetical protein
MHLQPHYFRRNQYTPTWKEVQPSSIIASTPRRMEMYSIPGRLGSCCDASQAASQVSAMVNN